MRILWLSHFLPFPPKGGALQRSHNLLRQASARHEVHLVSLNQAAILPRPEDVDQAVRALQPMAASVTVFPIPSDRSRLRWAALVAATAFRRQPYDVRWLANSAMFRHLELLARSERFDLLHVDTVGLWPYVGPFGATPIALTHHNIESQLMTRRADKEPRLAAKAYFRLDARKLAALELEASRRAAVNLVVSPLDADRLRDLVPDAAIRVVENGVDTDFFRPSGAPPIAGSMIFVGGMNWYPNRDAVLHFLREIWPALAAADRRRTITVVGAHPPDELVHAGDDRIRAPGFVDDVRPYLSAAEIYVCPMRDGGGTRLKIVDALAMAKPLVASRLAVEGIEVVDGEHYLRADTPSEFIAAVEHLSASPELRARLGASGRRLVEERYAWPVVAQSLERAYREAAAGPVR